MKTRKSLLLFLFRRGRGSLGGLRLGHALLEFVHASCRIHELLLAGVEGVAHIANANDNDRLGGARLYHVAASATNLRFHVFRVYVNFHKRPKKIPLGLWKTSRKLGIFVFSRYPKKRGNIARSHAQENLSLV